MSGGILKMLVVLNDPAELERIRRHCVEEGLLEEGELLDLEDVRYLQP